MKYKTWIELSKKNLLHNLSFFQKTVQPAEVMAVVKANAYGHGLEQVALMLKESPLTWFGVDQLEEALVLRRLGVKQSILVLGYIPKEDLVEAIKKNISFVLYTRTHLRVLQKVSSPSRKAHVHLKIETGLHRQGIELSDLPWFIRELKKSPGIDVEGMSTHFANVEDVSEQSYARLQLKRFCEASEMLSVEGIHPRVRHTSSSAAATLLPEARFNLIRLGISLYGLWSSEVVKQKTVENIVRRNKSTSTDTILKPVLSWKTVIAQLKNVQRDEPISYGLTERVKRDSIVAVLPIGYFDGFPRALSSIGEVLIRGKRCRVLGRICMNMCMVDVTGINGLKEGDTTVVLIGSMGKDVISPETHTEHISDSLNYEFMSRLNPLIPRLIK